jgi:serine/threonine protein phosphatase 1
MFTTNWQSIPGGLKADRPIFVIADVHGCYDQFEQALEACDQMASECPQGDMRPVIVPLGDYFDRGPENWACLDLAMHFRPQHADYAPLPGNHEQMLWAVLSGDAGSLGDAGHFARYVAYQIWDQEINGNAKLLTEIGLNKIKTDPEGFDRLNEYMPGVLAWFENLPTYRQFGDILLVHAGLPSWVNQMSDIPKMVWRTLPVDKEFVEDHPLWSRKHRVGLCEDIGVFMINGHTIVDDQTLLGNRLLLDTGCYQTGVLTVCELSGAKMRFHQFTPTFEPKLNAKSEVLTHT